MGDKRRTNNMEETETITGEAKPKAKLQTIKELGNLEHRRTRSLSPRSVARAVNQPVMDPARVKVSSGLRKKIDAAKKEKEQKRSDESSDKKKEKVLMDVEKELWESGDWRVNIKDLNASFSKLSPIIKENKVANSGQAFVVD